MVKKITILFFGLTLLFSLSVSAAMGGNDTSGHTAHMKTHHSTSTKNIDSTKAKSMMKIYMDNESYNGYKLKNFTDKGSYYKADIFSPKGTLLNKIVVNKKSGHVYFTKK